MGPSSEQSDSVSPSAADASSSISAAPTATGAAGGGDILKQKTAGATADPPKVAGYKGRKNSRPQPPQLAPAHYSQWPLPPNTYAAGRHSKDNEVASGGRDSSTVIIAAAVTADSRPSSRSSNSNGSVVGSGAPTASKNKASIVNDGNYEELAKNKDAAAKKKPQVIYSSNTVGGGGGAPPYHPPHPHHHHHHHAQYQAHYQQWYRHYAAHHQQRLQQQQQPQGHGGGKQHVLHHPPPFYHWTQQPQQQQQQQHYQAATMTKSSTNANTTTTDGHQPHQRVPTTTAPTLPPLPPPPSYSSMIYSTSSHDSSIGTKRNRRGDELNMVDSRDDSHYTALMNEEEVVEEEGTMSLGDFSMTSLGSSSPKGKRLKGTKGQKYHNSYDDDDDDDANSLELSDKEIINNLSMNSSYSSEIALLYGSSPTDSIHHHRHYNHLAGDNDDLGKTPKKNNTSSKKPRPYSRNGVAMDERDGTVFRLDEMTPSAVSSRFRNAAASEEDSSSPALLDLIGGAETPTTGLLMSGIENGMMDDIHSLNRNLRGHAFTPLPSVMGMMDAVSGGDASGLSITPQLSWSTNNGSPLEITPRCFGLVDSTKSMNKHPLGSPKSFWKESTTKAPPSSDERKKKGRGSISGEEPSILALLSPTMRDMEISHDASMGGSRSTTPLPLNYSNKDQTKDEERWKEPQELVKSTADLNPKTPVHHKPPPGYGMVRGGQQYLPVHHHHMQPSPWTQLGAYMLSPGPGAFQNISPGFGLYAHMVEPNLPDDRVRNLRGRGPPVHAIPPAHRLPPPSYHHFSPLTNVVQAQKLRAAAYHPQQQQQQHSNMPHQVDVSSASKSNCVPMKPPIPTKFQGDMNKYKDASVPDFNNLVNFPCHVNQKTAPTPEGTRNCVMCGHLCPSTAGAKQKCKIGNSHPLADNNQNKDGTGVNNLNFAIIPSQNKGLCTLCDVNVWIVLQSGMEIKWCKGCKNFRPWASFGEKGLATKCMRCRERQREKYAMEKDKKDKVKCRTASSAGRMVE